VGATVHTPEGLNTMVYNRCVGTRYCSNNCPYKVRRFNFLLFSDYETESLKLSRNPDVSVRSRGVMEKCSYCVQRISAAKIEADKENRAIADGEIQTACQQACPASAITFGNINDKGSRVAKLQADERSYQVLADQNTRPRTKYVAAVLNLNQELEEGRWNTRRRRVKRDDGDNGPETENPKDPTAVAGSTRSPESTGCLRRDRPSKSVTEKIAGIVLTPSTPLGWFALFSVGGAGATLLLVAVTWLFLKGTGIWAVTQPVAWGFAIINFVWWIGIGHAGTLISAILLLFKQGWRNSINRFAEAMTIFAVVCAGMFPLIHVGRPWLGYWLLPYPSTMNVWPQFRSPLLWDVFAVSTYATISVVFWYIGMVPDFGTLRDRRTQVCGQYAMA
jgi:Fe-S-cluster-containing dehydrogenase component